MFTCVSQPEAFSQTGVDNIMFCLEYIPASIPVLAPRVKQIISGVCIYLDFFWIALDVEKFIEGNCGHLIVTPMVIIGFVITACSFGCGF